jgi:hypothetical protein
MVAKAVLDESLAVWRLSADGANEEMLVPAAEMLKAWQATLAARVARHKQPSACWRAQFIRIYLGRVR